MKSNAIGSVVLLLFFIGISSSINFDPVKNYFNTGKNITKGAVESIPNYIPSPETIFESSKQLLAGYPFEAASTAINKVCSTVNSVNALKSKITPDIQNMSFLLMTPCQNFSFSLLRADEMWRSPQFDHSKKVVLLISGWSNTINESGIIQEISKAYLCRGNYNVIAVDAARYVDTLYTWSALNTEDIGENIAKGLVELSNIIPIENIHLIGHSLGSHIAGSAGRNFYYTTGKLLPRITGLDPAKPCFNEGENLSGLQRGDAEFVDVIHSNPGVLGKRDPTGDIDFYPGGLDPLPVGCYSVTCAHARAWEYYAETVYPGNEENFVGVRCGSLTRLRTNKCPGKSYPMGYAVPINVKGNFFLEVNGESPYGKNTPKNSKNQDECGMCNGEEKETISFE